MEAARKAGEMAFRYAPATPPERLDWSPAEGASSVLSLCRELALTSTWTLTAFGQVADEWSEQQAEAQRHEEMLWISVARCAEKGHRRFTALERFFLSLSDEDRRRTRGLPNNGGRDHTYREMMG